MSTNAIPATEPDHYDPDPRPPRRSSPLTWRAVTALASLKLTVVLFSIAMVLVFYGTLAQIDKGIWTVVDEYFRSWYVWIPFQLSVEFGKKFFDLPHDAHMGGSFPFPGGWLLGGVMLANLFAAHLTRFRLSWRRSGILLTHAGIILMMAGELVTGLYAVESRMVLQIGESSNFIDHSRQVELAITDSSDPKTNKVVTVPQDMLTAGNRLTDAALPFDFEVIEFLKNTDLHPTDGADDIDGVVRIDGVRYKVVPASEQSGVKSDREDAAAVRVKVFKKGTNEVLAERLLSLWQYDNFNGRAYMSIPLVLSSGGKEYVVQLRNERMYKPYTIRLDNFEHKQYSGTTTPKDFASTVTLTDNETGEVREGVRVWMNHPLRHRGETFYQASTVYSDTGTVLQVVKNPGWLLPYVSCAVVTLGLLLHFGLMLWKFVDRRTPRLASNTASQELHEQKEDWQLKRHSATWNARYFPWFVVAVFALYALGKAYPTDKVTKEMNLTDFGRLPVLDNGRVKPLDSVARTSLLYISGKSEFEDPNGDTQPAIRWLIDVMANEPFAGPAADYHVFRIDNEQVLNDFGLEERPGSYRYSINEILKVKDKLFTALAAAEKIDEKKRDLYHAKVIELSQRITLYERLSFRRIPTAIPKAKGSKEWVSLAEVDSLVANSFRQQAEDQAEAKVDAVLRESGKDPANLSPQEKRKRESVIKQLAGDELRNIAEKERGSVSPAAGAFGDILKAYKDNKPNAYAAAIKKYREEYAYPLNEEFRDTTDFEVTFNAIAPFFLAAMLYVFAGVFGALSWIGWAKPFRQAGIGLTALALALHLFGLLGRMYLMGRPLVFVTNLYSSALMIGFGAVAACLFVEWLFRNGVGLVVGTTLGAITVKIAHHLSTDGNDTLGTLVAVLDTNFWLASHVTTVTLGYAATYIAGLMGVVYIVWGLLFTTLDREKHKVLGKMIYGVTCFATLLSFVGTVLGGIWADQSWGRFWGWDPKENGAVLIVIWNTLILHARWGGVVKERGVAVLAVVGIMVTTWSWFGTNQLGVGLHNYGFNKSLADGCKYTWIVSTSIIIGGLIPLHYWRSYTALTGFSASQQAAPVPTPTFEPPPAPVVSASAPVENGHQNGHPSPKGKGKKHGKRR